MNTQKYKWSEVFVAGGFPVHTYYPRSTRRLEEKIQEAEENLCKLVIVTGHTKSGKTVLVERVFPREKAVWIDGGTATTEGDFWDFVVDALELYQSTEEQEENMSASELSGDVDVGASIGVAKAAVQTNTKFSAKNSVSVARRRDVSSKVVALQFLRANKTPLIIDDFHYLSTELQAKVVRALKPVVYTGTPVVVIAIPHRLYDAVAVEREMGGRVLPVQIPLWENTELLEIPASGFALLRVNVSEDITNMFADQSLGSPHLMQDFCRALCRESLVGEVQTIDVGSETIDNLLRDTAESIGRPIFDKLASGPRQRKDRKRRLLKDGTDVDIYGLVLKSLADIRPGLITLEYEDVRGAVRKICTQDDVPSIQEIARVLSKMSEIASTDKSSTPVIDFNEKEKRVHITDPFFAFYLRWGDLERK